MHVSSYKIYSRSQSKLGTVQRMTSTNDKVASSTHVALLVGATGLVGHAVLALLLAGEEGRAGAADLLRHSGAATGIPRMEVAKSCSSGTYDVML